MAFETTSSSRKRSKIPKALLIMASLTIGLLGYQGGEPISNTLRPRVYPPFPQTPSAFQSAVEDARIRLAYPKQELASPKHIILIMVDALRADHLGIYGYERATTPFLQSLKETGHLQQVDWTFASCSNSTCGIASTLNSRSIDQQGMSHFALHHLLHQQGYEVNFFLSGEHRPFYFLDKAHQASIDRFQDGINSGRVDPYHDDLVLEELDDLLVHQEDSIHTRSQFFYLHLMSAHSNRVLDSAYIRYQPTQSMRDWGHAEHLDYDHRSITNTYDNGVLQADAYLAAIWERLKRLKLLDNAIIVITGDHGEGLGEHGYYGHRYHLFPEGVRIPLLIYDVDSTSYQNLFFARQMDIAATLVDRIGLPIPANWEGRSLLAPLPAQSEAWMHTVERPGWYGKVSQQDSTLIYCVGEEGSGEVYWFDLREQIEGRIDSCAGY